MTQSDQARSKPIVIGLTGGIACGKSTLARMLRELGAPVSDADAISRALTAPGGKALPALLGRFGDRVFRDGALDRAALAEIVFSDAQERLALEAILHPMILGEIQHTIAACPSPAIVLDIPLLYESGMDALCDEIWCAYVPQKIQLERIRTRDRATSAQALARVRAQMPAREKARRAHFVIRTDQTPDACRQRIECLWRTIALRHPTETNSGS